MFVPPPAHIFPWSTFQAPIGPIELTFQVNDGHMLENRLPLWSHRFLTTA